MKTMKKAKKFSVLVLAMLLCIGTMTMQVFAAQTTQDGVEITLTTDQDTYEAGDEITATLTVHNTNTYEVTDVSLSHILLDGYTLAEGSELTKLAGTLAAGESVSLAVTYIPEVPEEPTEEETPEESTEEETTAEPTEEETPEAPDETLTDEDAADTGDTNTVLWIAVLFAAAAGAVALAVKHKKAAALLLCLSALGMTGLSATSAKAAEPVTQTVPMTETVQVEAEAVTVEAVVTYTVAVPETEGSITGTVRSAMTGEVLEGAAVVLYTQDNGEQSVVTDAAGNFTFTVLAGTYTLESTLDGYITASAEVTVTGGETAQADLVMSPVMEADEYRIVLTWGETPRDLDSHLTGPLSDGGRFHVYFSGKTAKDNDEEVAKLDLDDISCYGPETITLKAASTGVYKYAVQDYTNRRSEDSNALSMSGAKVELYQGDALIAVYNVPVDQIGTVWNVFEIEDGTVRTINTFENISSTSDVAK